MTNYTLDAADRILCDGTPTGYRLSRGAYVGTCDDRAAGWYIDRDDTDTLDRRGPGYATTAAALEAFAQRRN